MSTQWYKIDDEGRASGTGDWMGGLIHHHGSNCKTLGKEEEKRIKEEIKSWMNSELKKAAEKEAGKIFTDIEKLKEEKKRLGIAISSLKQELRNTKKEIQEEIKSMEDMLEKYANRILRFQNMDLE